MTMPIGGRGKKAPYETSVLRVPSPLMPKIQQMIDEYRNGILNSETVETNKISDLSLVVVSVDYSQAVEAARKIIKSKKSKISGIINLLQVIYGAVTSEEDLTE